MHDRSALLSRSLLVALLLIACHTSALAKSGERFVDKLERALWNDHGDVLDDAFIIKRKGYDKNKLAVELSDILTTSEKDEVKIRAIWLISRIGAWPRPVLDAVRQAAASNKALVREAAQDALAARLPER